MKRLLACCVLWLCTGCGADMGVIAPGIQARSGHFVGGGRLAASTRLNQPLYEEGFLLGMALENRAEAKVGSTWEGGIMAGWGWGPAAIDGTVGFEFYGEVGTQLRSVLFDHGPTYAGLGLGVPIRLSQERHVEKLNESTWIIHRGFELVPQLRTRVHFEPSQTGKRNLRIDIAAGAALRLRFFTDLL